MEIQHISDSNLTRSLLTAYVYTMQSSKVTFNEIVNWRITSTASSAVASNLAIPLVATATPILVKNFFDRT